MLPAALTVWKDGSKVSVEAVAVPPATYIRVFSSVTCVRLRRLNASPRISQVRLVHYPKPPRNPEIHVDDLRQPEGVAREQWETTKTGQSASGDARSQATGRTPCDTCRIRCSRSGKQDGRNGEAVEDCVRPLVIRPARCGRPDCSRRELVAKIEIRRALISGQVKRIRRGSCCRERSRRKGASRPPSNYTLSKATDNGQSSASAPKANADSWRDKIRANVRRDRDTDAGNAAAGWVVLRFWEHDDAALAATKIARLVKGRSRAEHS